MKSILPESIRLRIITTVAAIFILGVSNSYSQSRIVYGYDDAGNRISKSAYSPRAKSMNKTFSSKEDGISFQEDDGVVKIKLPNNDSTNKCEISVYSLSGVLLFSRAERSVNAYVSLANYPQGIYIIKVVCKGKITSYKVEKR